MRAKTGRERGAKRPYHHGQLREALVQAAVDIIEEEGVARLTLRKAARRVGVSHAAPAHHFGGLRGLLAAAAAEGYRYLHGALVEAYHATPEAEPAARLQATGLAYVTSAVQAPGRFRVTFHPALADKSNDVELEDASQATFNVLLEAIVACQAAGVIRDGDPREFALTAWSIVHGLAVLAVDDQLRGKGFVQDPRDLAAAVTTHLFVGLGAAPTSNGATGDRKSERVLTRSTTTSSTGGRKG